MYKFPADFDLSFLSECYLERVCFGIRVTRLDFSRPQVAPGLAPYKVSLSVEAGLEYEVKGVIGRREFSESATSAPLLDLLLKDVDSVERRQNSTLAIFFKSGESIVVEESVDGYEAYTIYLDSGEIIVV